MPSTYSPSLRLELMGAGDQAGNWGNTTNTNLGSLIEQAITGVGQITMLDATTTLTVGSGITDQSRNAVLVLNGTLTASRDLIIPSVNKVYCIFNNTSGGFNVNIKTISGASIPVGSTYALNVFCDGFNVVPVNVTFSPFNSDAYIGGDLNIAKNTGMFGDLSVVGNTSMSGNLSVSGAVSSGGAVLMPTGAMLEYGGATAPTGWLLCNGASVSRATYAALFDVIGTAYGSVDINTFNVPDRRDRVAVGAGSTYARGATGGAATATTSSDGIHSHGGTTAPHTLSTAEIPPHTHGGAIRFTGSINYGLTYGPDNITTGFSYDGGEITQSTGGGFGHDHDIYSDGAHTHSVSTIQPYVASNFIIKA